MPTYELTSLANHVNNPNFDVDKFKTPEWRKTKFSKTARAKAKGHVAGKKNRRIWDGKSANDPNGKWIKV